MDKPDPGLGISSHYSTTSLEPIKLRYALNVGHCYYEDYAGKIWMERTWHRDFVRHLMYLPCLTLIASRMSFPQDANLDLVKLDLETFEDLKLVAMPKKTNNPWRDLKNIPNVIYILWKTIANADVVQAGEVGLPVCWMGNVLALLMRKPLIIIVESSPWRLTGVARDTKLFRKLKAPITELIVKFFVNRSSIVFFTQSGYRESLLSKQIPNYVIPATWIDEDEIISEPLAFATWKQKSCSKPPKLLFAGRLISEKGIEILLTAFDILRSQNIMVQIDVLGDGPLRVNCERQSQVNGATLLNVLSPVSYGDPFFRLLQDYHAVIIPNLGDEQPRIVFDAYSQAVPVIASDTDGLRPHVIEGSTGWLIKRGSAHLLAERIKTLIASPGALETAGLAAREYAIENTHRKMHINRWKALLKHFKSKAC